MYLEVTNGRNKIEMFELVILETGPEDKKISDMEAAEREELGSILILSCSSGRF